jgi:hypothetical protein
MIHTILNMGLAQLGSAFVDCDFTKLQSNEESENLISTYHMGGVHFYL